MNRVRAIRYDGQFVLTEEYENLEMRIPKPVHIIFVMGKNGLKNLWEEFGIPPEYSSETFDEGLYIRYFDGEKGKTTLYVYIVMGRNHEVNKKYVLMGYLLANVVCYTSVCGLDKSESRHFGTLLSECYKQKPSPKPNFVWFIQDVVWNSEDENQMQKLLHKTSMRLLFNKKEIVTLYSFNKYRSNKKEYTSPESYLVIETKPLEKFFRNIDFNGLKVIFQYFVNDFNGNIKPDLDRHFFDYLDFIQRKIKNMVVDEYENRMKKDLAEHLPLSENIILKAHTRHSTRILSYILNKFALLTIRDRKKLHKRIKATLEKEHLSSFLQKNKEVSVIRCNQSLAELYFKNIRPLDHYHTMKTFHDDLQKFKSQFLQAQDLGPSRFTILSNFLKEERSVINRLLILIKAKRRKQEEEESKFQLDQKNNFYYGSSSSSTSSSSGGGKRRVRRRISVYTPSMTSSGIPKMLVSKIRILGISDKRASDLILNIKFFKNREVFISHLRKQVEDCGKKINALLCIGGVYFLSCCRRSHITRGRFNNNNNNNIYTSSPYKIEVTNNITKRIRSVYEEWKEKKDGGEIMEYKIHRMYKDYNSTLNNNNEDDNETTNLWYIVWKKTNNHHDRNNRNKKKNYFYMYLLNSNGYRFRCEIENSLENRRDWVSQIYFCEEFWFATVTKKFFSLQEQKEQQQHSYQDAVLLHGGWKKMRLLMIRYWKKGYSVASGASNYCGNWFLLLERKERESEDDGEKCVNNEEWYHEIFSISQLQEFMFETRLIRMYLKNLIIGIKE